MVEADLGVSTVHGPGTGAGPGGGGSDPAARAVVLAVDLGTTATKVLAVDREGVAHAGVERGYPMGGGPHDQAVHDPEQVLLAAITALRDCVSRCMDERRPIAALSFSGAMHTLLALDARFSPLMPALSWADGRAADTARRLRAQDGGRLARELHTATGTPVHPMSPLVKLAWFREHEPELHRSAAWWCGLKDYVLRRFTGQLVMDLSCASATGLLDIHKAGWYGPALALAGIGESRLPELVEPTVPLPLSAHIAASIGVPAGLPVVAGAGDGPLANLGVGAVSPGSAALSLGTSGALRVTRRGPAVDGGGRAFCYALADDLWVVGGAISNGGLVAQWAADTFGEPDINALLSRAAALPPDADTPVALPYLLPERAPYWDPDPRGALLGLRREHGPAEITRALVDGVGHQLAMVRDSVLATGASIDRVLATGGALRGPLWADVLASALDLPLYIPRTASGSALGAGLLGWRALGALYSLSSVEEELRQTAQQPVYPNPEIKRRLARTRGAAEFAYWAMTQYPG
jgi:gluconokinase